MGGIWCPLEESAAVAWLGTNPGLCLPSPGLTAPFVTINHLAQTFQPPGQRACFLAPDLPGVGQTTEAAGLGRSPSAALGIATGYGQPGPRLQEGKAPLPAAESLSLSSPVLGFPPPQPRQEHLQRLPLLAFQQRCAETIPRASVQRNLGAGPDFPQDAGAQLPGG